MVSQRLFMVDSKVSILSGKVLKIEPFDEVGLHMLSTHLKSVVEAVGVYRTHAEEGPGVYFFVVVLEGTRRRRSSYKRKRRLEGPSFVYYNIVHH